MLGTVKWFSAKKGYGFLVPEDSDKEVFVHYSAISGDGFKTLEEGDRVQFEIFEDEKGPRAKDVVVSQKNTSNESASDTPPASQ